VSILKKIVKFKKNEVKQAKLKMPIEEIMKEIMKAPANRNFKDVFENNPFSIIAEIKKKSPSKGVLRASIVAGKLAKLYEEAGARAISVVTDKKFFDGKMAYIQEVKKDCYLPVLRKDFIIDEYQLYESRAARADAVLLIASILDKKTLNKFVKKCRFMNMTPVVETHSAEDIKKAVSSGADIIGINTRDLKNFKTDFKVIKNLLKNVPKDKIVIIESGILKVSDIEKIKIDSRIKGVLIGSMFMKAKETQIKSDIREIMNKYGND